MAPSTDEPQEALMRDTPTTSYELDRSCRTVVDERAKTTVSTTTQRHLDQHLNRVFYESGHPSVALYYLHLDYFDTINDGLGHDIGDLLINAAANRLHHLLAHTGHLLFHSDADKFAVVVDNPSEDLRIFAEQIRRAIAVPFDLGLHRLTVTVSVGAARSSTDQATPARLKQAASTALHWAKADGRNRTQIFNSIRAATDAARQRLSADMAAALDRGELSPWYQPLVSLTTGSIVGFEALARWHHPRAGLLTPDQFIDLAHINGTTIALGTTILRQACHQAAAWSQQGGSAPYISVNLAVAQLRDPDLCTTVTGILGDSGLSPDRLQLEITEDIATYNEPTALANIRTLASNGIRIALDDFGTGYANLAALVALPLTEVKIALPLVQRLDQQGTDNDPVLSAITQLALSLCCTITAEGIETAAQAARMRAAGCQTAQGWYYGRPAPAGPTAHLLNEHMRLNQ
jgi:diguanylate cyclase (GGDEF)-like protein